MDCEPDHRLRRGAFGIFEPLRLGAFVFTCAAIFYVEYLLLSWLGLA